MKKILIILLLLSVITTPCHAVNFLEKLLYKEDTIKVYGTNVLVVPVTGEVKYVWCGNPASGYWMPVRGKVKQQYQALYDRQKAS